MTFYGQYRVSDFSVPGALVSHVPSRHNLTSQRTIVPADSESLIMRGLNMRVHRFAQMLANGGTLDGQRYLRSDLVDELLTNQLPKYLMPYSMLGVYDCTSIFCIHSAYLY
jgi:hypothetical protein